LGTWTRHVDAFIALTDFLRDRMIAAGLPAELLDVAGDLPAGDGRQPRKEKGAMSPARWIEQRI